MKKMIRMAMMAAAMFTVVTATAKAQGGGGAGGGRGRGPNIMALLKDSLHVSDAVMAKADSINKAYMAQVAPMQGNAEMRPQMMEARTKMTDAIKALLTDEQKASLEKMMPAGGRRGGGF